MPRNVAKSPDVQAVSIGPVKLYVCELGIVSVIVDGLKAILFGINATIVRSPVWGPGDIVNPNVVELLPSGVLVPLSTHAPAGCVPLQVPCNGSSIMSARAAFATSIPAMLPAATSAESPRRGFDKAIFCQLPNDRN